MPFSTDQNKLSRRVRKSEFRGLLGAHVRRKFLDVFNAGYVKAELELKLIRDLYQIEADAKLRAEKKNTETALFQERKVARRASVKL